MVFCKLEIKGDVAISGFPILVGSLTRFAMTFNERHPIKNAVQIDYAITNIMLPTVLLGSALGIIFFLSGYTHTYKKRVSNLSPF